MYPSLSRMARACVAYKLLFSVASALVSTDTAVSPAQLLGSRIALGNFGISYIVQVLRVCFSHPCFTYPYSKLGALANALVLGSSTDTRHVSCPTRNQTQRHLI